MGRAGSCLMRRCGGDEFDGGCATLSTIYFFTSGGCTGNRD